MAAEQDSQGPRLSRRRLLALASAAAAALAFGQPGSTQSPASGSSPSPSAGADRTKVQGTPISHLGNRSPFVHLERTFADNPTRTASWSLTPLQDLNGIITPSQLHFERHHAGVPTIDPAKHRLLIHGLVDRPMEYTIEDIKRFPSSTRIMFLECSGNSLDGWGTPKPDATAQSLHGLASTGEWTGVPVSTLLKEVGVKPEAKWALAEGADAAMMDRSIPIEKLMSDAFIAYGQNGEDIRPEQGFPMRLMLPGWEGNANIKWLRRLQFGTGPWMTREETSKYTDVMPDGTAWQFTFPMEAKSLITWPSGGQVVPGLGQWEVTGVAWSGRGKIQKVEISTDNGQTWQEAQLQDPVLPISFTRFRHLWNWNGDEVVLMSRATDETGYVQPTKQQLVAVRGTQSVYHYNGIQPWRVGKDGKVANAST